MKLPVTLARTNYLVPTAYAVDRGTAITSEGTKEVVQLLIHAKGIEHVFVLDKVDAKMIGMALDSAADDSKRIADVKAGVNGL